MGDLGLRSWSPTSGWARSGSCWASRCRGWPATTPTGINCWTVAITDTLIADADGVYHPADFNDRLVLGLKGTMSEAELHLIRSRLTAGLKHKAAKGELRQGLPVGLDYDEDDKVVLCADEAVREAITTVFRRFDELGSARQVLIRLR